MQPIATALGTATPGEPGPAAQEASRAGRWPRIAGQAALGGLVACLLLLGANAASGRSSYVPSGRHGLPGWLAGPLAPLGFTTAHAVLEGLVLAACGCYAVVLACERELPDRAVALAVAAGTLAALLSPPLLSTDVLGYIGFARLGVLHGLDPYSFAANAAPHDAIYPYLGWHTVTTPYGPLFTLLSYAIEPLGIAAGLWAFKLIAAAASLATVRLLWLTAAQLGRSPRRAIAIYGLNPLVLVFAVAGAHNDTLLGLLVAAAALALVTRHERAGAAATSLAIAVKLTAGLIAPFAWIGARRRGAFAQELAITLIVLAAVALAVFGTHIDGIWSALRAEQHQVARHGVPAEISGLLGAGRPDAQGVRLAAGIRAAFIVAFALALGYALWRAWRGAFWLDCYGWATLALLAASAWLLPWYGTWALLPAAVSRSRALVGTTLAASAYLVAIKIL
ncbi:MAG TPA: glycosyltransferase 87 family protein [Solirubrobacteraceae bacterium]|nr:glycosyltransferase 87 family protein [Solirubrobacteraceae bacterium]